MVDERIYEQFRMIGRDMYTSGMISSHGGNISMRVGERVYNMERLYNIREGFGKKDDTLPDRLLNDPVTDGPSKGWVSRLEPMLKEYYRARRWDENGVPLPSKLAELDLADL